MDTLVMLPTINLSLGSKVKDNIGKIKNYYKLVTTDYTPLCNITIGDFEQLNPHIYGVSKMSDKVVHIIKEGRNICITDKCYMFSFKIDALSDIEDFNTHIPPTFVNRKLTIVKYNYRGLAGYGVLYDKEPNTVIDLSSLYANEFPKRYLSILNREFTHVYKIKDESLIDRLGSENYLTCDESIFDIKQLEKPIAVDKDKTLYLQMFYTCEGDPKIKVLKHNKNLLKREFYTNNKDCLLVYL